MNSSTYIRFIRPTLTPTRASFYDLYLVGESDPNGEMDEVSERELFFITYSSHADLPWIYAIMTRMERQRLIGESSLDYLDIFRPELYGDDEGVLEDPENQFVAIPGKGDNADVKGNRETDLRLFCFKPNNKTLIYLNGYAHGGVDGLVQARTALWQHHPEFAPRGFRLLSVVKAIHLCNNLRLKSTGGYENIVQGSEVFDFDLSDYLQ